MTITKNSLIMMIFFLTIKRSLTQSANSQILIKTIFYFTLINLLMKRAVSENSLRFVRIANYPLAALFLCFGGAYWECRQYKTSRMGSKNKTTF